MLFEDLGLLFFSVLMLSLLFTPVSIRIAYYVGAVDQPVNRSVHNINMPRMGGLGMAAALLIGLPLFLPLNPILTSFLAGLLIITFTGIADDVWRIHPLVKMGGQLIACLVFIESSGIYLHSFGNPFGLGEIVFLEPFAQTVTLFCLLGVINAFNMSDGLDGLAAGIAAIACFFFAALALDSQANLAFILATATFAATLGFLKYNSHPARLFMGDAGSLMLGYAIGCLAVMLGGEFKSTVAPITVATVIGLPLVDTLWVMSSRLAHGKSPLFPDNLHLHHRLLALGFSHATVVSLIYLWMITMGLFALMVKDFPEYWQLFLGVLFIGLIYLLLILCEYRKIDLSPFFGNTREEEHRLRHRFTYGMLRSTELLLYFVPVVLCGPVLLATSVPESINQLVLALAAFACFVFLLKRNSTDKVNIIYGIFYICAFIILFVWHISSYESLYLSRYATLVGGLLFIWSTIKIKFGWRHEVLLTSSFEILLIFISWFLPYIMLPALAVSEDILNAAKFACLVSIPMFVTIKLVTRRKLDRDIMAVGLVSTLLLIGIRSL